MKDLRMNDFQIFVIGVVGEIMIFGIIPVLFGVGSNPEIDRVMAGERGRRRIMESFDLEHPDS
jgi:hypothetical protein